MGRVDTDNSGSRFCPHPGGLTPGGALVWWLHANTPDRAPVLPLTFVDPPLTAIPAIGVNSRMRELGLSHDVQWLLTRPPVLRDVPLAGERPLTEGVLALASDAGRARGKLAGQPWWRMEAATLRDIVGWSNQGLARLLGVTVQAGHYNGARSRGVERHVTAGRRLLHELGAWPWAHAQNGRLPREWWTLDVFSAPLLAWQAAHRVGEKKIYSRSASD